MLGVCDGTRVISSGTGSLKRDLLFFDRLVLLGGKQGLAVLQNSERNSLKYRGLADELEYLFGTPYFESYSSDATMAEIGDPQSDDDRSANRAIAWIHDREQDALRLKEELESGPATKEKLQAVIDVREEQVSILTRLEALRRTRLGERATSNEPIPTSSCFHGAPLVGDVIRITIKLVPSLDCNTPWEDIFALKSDKDVTERARKLRLWAEDQVGLGDPISRLSERIADTVSDYERVLTAYKVKYNSSMIQTVVAGGLIEDVVKLRLEKAASRFFSARIAKADLLIAEAAIPGRELSLVTIIRDKLRSSQP